MQSPFENGTLILYPNPNPNPNSTLTLQTLNLYPHPNPNPNSTLTLQTLILYLTLTRTLTLQTLILYPHSNPNPNSTLTLQTSILYPHAIPTLALDAPRHLFRWPGCLSYDQVWSLYPDLNRFTCDPSHPTLTLAGLAGASGSDLRARACSMAPPCAAAPPAEHQAQPTPAEHHA